MATTLPRVLVDRSEAELDNRKPCARALASGVALAILMWALIVWGVRALF